MIPPSPVPWGHLVDDVFSENPQACGVVHVVSTDEDGVYLAIFEGGQEPDRQ